MEKHLQSGFGKATTIWFSMEDGTQEQRLEPMIEMEELMILF